MAERRMFAKTIIDSDAFLDMPLSTQALYFHLSMAGDDDGFINNPKRIQRVIGASEDDLKLLVAKNFIIPFESGVVVVKHWHIHNYIRNDRYKTTAYQEEKNLLSLKDNGAYTLGIPKVTQMETQSSLVKDRIGKDRERVEEAADNSAPSLEDISSFVQENNLNIDAERFYNYYTATNWYINNTKIRSWQAVARMWSKTERDKPEEEIEEKATDNNGEWGSF